MCCQGANLGQSARLRLLRLKLSLPSGELLQRPPALRDQDGRQRHVFSVSANEVTTNEAFGKTAAFDYLNSGRFFPGGG